MEKNVPVQFVKNEIGTSRICTTHMESDVVITMKDNPHALEIEKRGLLIR
jgi:hypothetical protein